ncbi:MAG: hypothetical protein RR740_23755, partial [Pseudomonas sp.]
LIVDERIGQCPVDVISIFCSHCAIQISVGRFHREKAVSDFEFWSYMRGWGFNVIRAAGFAMFDSLSSN